MLPVVVVLWATLAIVGGAVHLVNEAEAATQGSAAKAGLGLCAVSVAFFAGKARGRARPLVPAVMSVALAAPPIRLFAPPEHHAPPPVGPPLLLLLRVSRT